MCGDPWDMLQVSKKDSFDNKFFCRIIPKAKHKSINPESGVTMFQPRDGERGGTFGNGKVVRTYAEGQVTG